MIHPMALQVFTSGQWIERAEHLPGGGNAHGLGVSAFDESRGAQLAQRIAEAAAVRIAGEQREPSGLAAMLVLREHLKHLARAGAQVGVVAVCAWALHLRYPRQLRRGVLLQLRALDSWRRL